MGDDWGDFSANRFDDNWSAAEGSDPFGGDKKPKAKQDPFFEEDKGDGRGAGGGEGGKWPEYDSDGSGHGDEYGDHFASKPPPKEDYFADERGDVAHMGMSAPDVQSDDDYTAEEGRDGVAPLGTDTRKSGSGPPPGSRSMAQSLASQRMRELQKSLNDGANEDAVLEKKSARKSGVKGGGKEKNKRFQDVEKTGKWGALNKWEIIFASVFVIGAIVAVVVVILVVVVPNSEGGAEVEQVPLPPGGSAAPTSAPTSRDDYGYELIKQASPQVNEWPSDPEAMMGSKDNPSALPQYKAAEFVLYDDPLKLKPSDPWFIQRYALYNLYLTTSGETWTDSTAWPSGLDTCEFHGVVCDNRKSHVLKLLLDENGMTGRLPYEIASLTELTQLDVYGNNLIGPLPVQAFIDLKKLTTLDVQDNNLTGEISPDLKDSNILDFYVTDSGLSGDIPAEICGGMDTIVTDCTQNDCPNTDDCWNSCQGPTCWS